MGGRASCLGLRNVVRDTVVCLVDSAADGSSAATAYEGNTCDHLDTKALCETRAFAYVPMFVDASGGWAPFAGFAWSELASLMTAGSGDSLTTTTMRILQSVGIVLQRESARAIFRRAENPTDDNFALGVADA